MQTVIVNKFVIGMMALFVMLGMNNLMFKSGNIDARIYKHENNQFFGELIIKDKKLPLIVNVDGENEVTEKTYNENKNYHEDKEYTEYKEINNKNEINENKQYNEQKDHNINNNSNKKEEKHNENIKITDDKTPGSIEIVIKNGDAEVNITRKIGSREMSEIDKEICRKSIDATTDFIQSIKGNAKNNIKNNVIEKVKGFKDYINKDKPGRWFKW